MLYPLLITGRSQQNLGLCGEMISDVFQIAAPICDLPFCCLQCFFLFAFWQCIFLCSFLSCCLFELTSPPDRQLVFPSLCLDLFSPCHVSWPSCVLGCSVTIILLGCSLYVVCASPNENLHGCDSFPLLVFALPVFWS